MWRKRQIMTLPDERYRSIRITEQLLRDLCDPKQTPRIPSQLRQRAAQCLRHYPGEYDLQQLESAAPHVIQQRMEPLYKMIKQHEMADSVSKDYAAEGMIQQHDSAARKINTQDPDWEPHS